MPDPLVAFLMEHGVQRDVAEADASRDAFQQLVKDPRAFLDTAPSPPPNVRPTGLTFAEAIENPARLLDLANRSSA